LWKNFEGIDLSADDSEFLVSKFIEISGKIRAELENLRKNQNIHDLQLKA